MLAGGFPVAVDPADEILPEPAEGAFPTTQPGRQQPVDRAEDSRNRHIRDHRPRRHLLQGLLDHLSDLPDPAVALIERPRPARERLLHQEPCVRRLEGREPDHRLHGRRQCTLRRPPVDSVADLPEKPPVHIDDRRDETVILVLEIVVERRAGHPRVADHRGHIRPRIPLPVRRSDHPRQEPFALGRLTTFLHRRVYLLFAGCTRCHEALDPTALASRSLENTRYRGSSVTVGRGSGFRPPGTHIGPWRSS